MLVSAVLLVGVGIFIILVRPDVWLLGVLMFPVAVIQAVRAVRGYRRGVESAREGGNDADLR
jgi:hypothetical protein